MQTSNLESLEKLKNQTFPLNDALDTQINFLPLISSIDDFIDSKPSSFYQLPDKWLKFIENEGDDVIR
jgi:hypothetical protein